VAVLVYTPRYDSIFRKLEECGRLPQPTQWLVAISRLNVACFYVPALFLAIALFAVDAVMVRHLCRGVRGEFWSWLWVVAVALAALPAALLVIAAFILPIFAMGNAVQ
jgi:hypothetical protein